MYAGEALEIEMATDWIKEPKYKLHHISIVANQCKFESEMLQPATFVELKSDTQGSNLF